MSSDTKGNSFDISRFYGLIAGIALVGIRVASAIVNPIADCDETFNYWEPLHYLVYGFGMQTWEYSPEYTLRSYSYLLPHTIVGHLLALPLYLFQKQPNKTLIFYGIRILLGLVSAACEASFIDGVTRRFGPRPGIFTLLLLLTSAGVFQSSTAMLPSSAAAYLVMLVHARWLRRRYARATLLAVLAVLGLGWPFVALLFVPLALHVLLDQIQIDGTVVKGLTRVIGWGLMSLILVLPSVLLIDFFYYKRLAFPALSILIYNIGGGPEGADDKLYGVEPWTFYFKNLLVHLNIALPLALALPMALLILPWPEWSPKTRMEAAIFCSPAWLWLAVMTTRPHKEERFLFPIYPLLAMSAALTLHGIINLFDHRSSSGSKVPNVIARLFAFLARFAGPGAIILHTILSSSRVISMTKNFGGPLALYNSLYHQEFRQIDPPPALAAAKAKILDHAGEDSKKCPPQQWHPKRLCVGDEWYRFPTSFFLPHEGVTLNFIRSGFHGQLPQPFMPKNGTWAPPLQPFNQYNREEMSRYIPLRSCNYLVELFPPPKGSQDRSLVDNRLIELGEPRPWAWNVVRQHPLLDKDMSPSPYRAFWIPFLSHRFLHFGEFTLLQRSDEAGLVDELDHGAECRELGG